MNNSIFQNIKIDANKKAELDKIERHQLELESESREKLDVYESDLDKILEGKETADVSNLSELDAGIHRGEQFKGEISDLALSLTDELNELGQFLGDMTQYKGITEKAFSYVGWTNMADRARMSRIKSSDVRQNLESVLDFGHNMVGKLYQAIVQNAECHTRLETTVIKTAEKIEENQPHYQKWSDDRERLERKLEKIGEELDNANPDQYGSIANKKADVQKKLDEAQVNENHYFTIVDKAKQALPIQEDHRESYKNLVDALTQFKTGLEQDIDNVTAVYASAPTAIKTALSIKAASQYDKGMKYATDIATDTVLKSVEGVLKETASRAERPLIEPDKLEAYRKSRLAMRAEFEERIGDLKERYEATKNTS